MSKLCLIISNKFWAFPPRVVSTIGVGDFGQLIRISLGRLLYTVYNRVRAESVCGCG